MHSEKDLQKLEEELRSLVDLKYDQSRMGAVNLKYQQALNTKIEEIRNIIEQMKSSRSKG